MTQCVQAGIMTPDGTFAIVATGSLDERLLRRMVEHLPDGTWELVCHPGYNDADLQKIHTRLRESREQELRILTSSVDPRLACGKRSRDHLLQGTGRFGMDIATQSPEAEVPTHRRD